MSGNPTPGDGSTLAWFKSSYSSSGDGNSCVEVATTPDTIHVRDSKYRDASPRLALAPEAWADFVAYASES
ncbi:DUF397 domain-containing protein [Streptomyces sp. NBC_00557]|uniref:DUF397 domain-containing protein n=1 Tax=Streptomyces sp. NBC_00557 TaxID=2975776 RepID=UPI002E7FCA14|nr:DUF397 domain-containing protein [Streptomyces sp. NBC_00557]WUC35797.1 DUF397 domain-containing protein [Streptomyces sp. NBC_00557]